MGKEKRTKQERKEIKAERKKKGFIKRMTTPTNTNSIQVTNTVHDVNDPHFLRSHKVDNISDNFARTILKLLINKLDDEDLQKTFGEQGWRNYFFGEVEGENPITPTEKAAA